MAEAGLLGFQATELIDGFLICFLLALPFAVGIARRLL